MVDQLVLSPGAVRHKCVRREWSERFSVFRGLEPVLLAAELGPAEGPGCRMQSSLSAVSRIHPPGLRVDTRAWSSPKPSFQGLLAPVRGLS